MEEHSLEHKMHPGLELGNRLRFSMKANMGETCEVCAYKQKRISIVNDTANGRINTRGNRQDLSEECLKQYF